MKTPKHIQEIIDDKTDHVAEAEKIIKEGEEHLKKINKETETKLRKMLF